MSADIWIEIDPCPACGRSDAGSSMNLTYNLSPMLWGAGMPAWSEFIGMDAHEAGLIWEAVVDELRADRNRYESLNPPNGWGTYEQAVSTLAEFAADCEEAPDGARIGGWL